LHTHVAVANKVQTFDGRWLSIDGRVLFKANVAASETYNTALEQHLRDALGVRFMERPSSDPTKRPVREIVGVDPRLNQRWSTRRAHIQVRQGELAVAFQRDHGRPLIRSPSRLSKVPITTEAKGQANSGRDQQTSIGSASTADIRATSRTVPACPPERPPRAGEELRRRTHRERPHLAHRSSAVTSRCEARRMVVDS
jgi:hypothetical protein